MQKGKIMFKKRIDLHLFDEAGASEAGTAQVAPGQAAGTDENPKVAAGERKSFEELIEGEYKDDFKKEMSKRIKDRLKGSKEAEERLKTLEPTLSLLVKHYGLDAENPDYEALSRAVTEDDAYYEDAAMAAGLDVKTFKKMEQMKFKNAQLESEAERARKEEEQRRFFENLATQEAGVKEIYPNFDLRAELENENFARLVFNNVPARTAFEVVHKDEIISGAMQFAAKKAEKALTDNILAGGQRPPEAAAGTNTPTKTGFDASKLTKEERAKIRERVLRGERVTF